MRTDRSGSLPDGASALWQVGAEVPGGLAGAFTLWLGPRFWRALPPPWQERTRDVVRLWPRRRVLLRTAGVPPLPGRGEVQEGVGALYGEILRLSGQARGAGAFYTPLPLARRLTAMTLGPHLADPVRRLKDALHSGDRHRVVRGLSTLSGLRVADLSVGGGVFLLAALELGLQVLCRMERWARCGGIPWTDTRRRRWTGALLRRLWGIDLDPVALGIAGYLLSRRARVRGRPRLIQADALLDGTWSRRSFPVIVGNPPWEALKPSLREFFVSRYPALAEVSRQEVEVRLPRLLEDSRDRQAYARYEEERRTQIRRLQQAPYPLQKAPGMRSTDLNLWKYFLERTDQVLGEGGSFGLLLPHGVIGDMGATALRQRLFTAYRQVRLFTVEGINPFFPGVKQGFVLLVARRRGGAVGVSRQPLTDRSGRLLHGRAQGWTPEEIRRFSPRTMTPPGGGAGESVLLEAFAGFPALADAPWGLTFGRELHLTDHRAFFGLHPTPLPLWEGKAVEPLLLAPAPRLFVQRVPWQTERRGHKRARDGERYRLAWRDVMGQDFDQLKATLVPPGGVLANTLNYLLTPLPREPLLYLLGVLVSPLAAWRLRGLRTSNHVNTYVVAQLEVPPWTGDPPQQRIVDLVARVLGRDWRLRQAVLPTAAPVALWEEDFWPLLDLAVAGVYGVDGELLARIPPRKPRRRGRPRQVLS